MSENLLELVKVSREIINALSKMSDADSMNCIASVIATADPMYCEKYNLPPGAMIKAICAEAEHKREQLAKIFHAAQGKETMQ